MAKSHQSPRKGANTPADVKPENISPSQPKESFDVVIVGAGVSGINTARYLESDAPRGTSYVILDRRSHWGGTWDLFKYPGIRSDSDMSTFGYSWNPWHLDKPLATGPEIATYLSSSAAKVGADQHTRFQHQVLSANWSSAASRWTVTATKSDGERVDFICRFMVLGTGYYNYDEPLKTTIPGLDQFSGRVIKPQFWPEKLDYMNKKIVVIGSGATAVTLLPSLAEDAKHVTMLQRSPTYIATLPMSGGIVSKVLGAILPKVVVRRWNRVRRLLMGYMFYYFCMWYPKQARDLLERGSALQLLPGAPVRPNHSPRYNPWEQRLCVCPDGDFYAALRSGKADVVTDVIEEVTSHSIVLKSGQKLQPDIIVAATGLQLQFAGGIKISIDEQAINPSSKFAWKGCMLQDVPNLFFVIGYVNASWTLSAETTATLLVRLLWRMRARGANVALPTLQQPEKMTQVPLFNLSSTYVKGSASIFPKGGIGQWAQKKNHIVDAWQSSWGDIVSGLTLK
ncbi:FAD/NAD(P)-binding domain-containing protein [Aaosphaeria arxii CBS 175.79]|uniref:FAD/NAD(P)-binding domain-containing protein n=1 Tax=Aaosphaeria arxii CBS 175.79 TaxID=1450172 RepID=A0A6A5XZN4_9PLEO|nr:FAD/NAD(P)-binding domain-containing protein [Aaosphaeria arxii CBS 175.79]KAF2017744.1 FAD/NAD(P)-binding domain-containing protein [Aaosphaeria arxii CBS 175.79]